MTSAGDDIVDRLRLASDRFKALIEAPSRAYGIPMSDRVAVKRDEAAMAQYRLAEAADRIASDAATIEKLREALTNLVNKLDAVTGPVNSMTVFANAHGYKYTGPNYGEELEEARAALATGAKT